MSLDLANEAILDALRLDLAELQSHHQTNSQAFQNFYHSILANFTPKSIILDNGSIEIRTPEALVIVHDSGKVEIFRGKATVSLPESSQVIVRELPKEPS